MKILIKVPVYPTESKEKVIEAVENIFPGTEPEESRTDENVIWLEGPAPNINRFTELLTRQKIRDTARAFLMHRLKGNKISFSLNKQAAFAGRINFIERDSAALGSIDILVEHDEPERLIEMITHIPTDISGGLK